MSTSSRIVFLVLLVAAYGPVGFAKAQEADTACVRLGAAADLISLDHSTRPIQREVFQGIPAPGGRNAPPEGTVVRVYSTPLELTGDFDNDGVSDTVRALTEVAGPGGSDPCPAGPNGAGCLQGERIVQHPFWSSTGEWTLPADFSGIPRSEERISWHVPRAFEIRFTADDAGSFAWHAFTPAAKITRFPVEVWDIGNVAPGSPNDPSDDVRMALVAFSDNGGECTFGYGELELEPGAWVSDRLYAYYFREGVTYEDFHTWVRTAIPLVIELEKPLGSTTCSGNEAGMFACDFVDLRSYVPNSVMGVESIADVWGWRDPVTLREYALVAALDRVAIVDVTESSNTHLVGHLTDRAQDVKVYADHLFAVIDGGSPPAIFDLTQLRNVSTPPVEIPRDTAYVHPSGSRYGGHNIAINEETGFAYILGDRGGSGCPGLHMVDIRNPLDPVYAGCFLAAGVGRGRDGYVHDAQCVVYRGPDLDYQGREVCFTASETHITVVDVEDKSAPALISAATYPGAEYLHQGWLTENHEYFVQGDELDEDGVIGTRTYIWDVRDLDSPILSNTYESALRSTDHNLYIKGQHVYQANYTSGLRVLDISDIDAPREVAFFDTYPFSDNAGFRGAWTAYPFLESGNILVSSRDEGLFVLSMQPGVALDPIEPSTGSFTLFQNYPNPFSATTVISYSVPHAADVTLKITDLLGRTVKELVSATQGPGTYNVSLAADLSSGVYFYRLEAGDYVDTKMMAIVR